MVDETENENAYTQIIPDTEKVAMNRGTYINVDQSDLKQCIKFSVMYFCKQTFLMKHTSEHTCETAIYHEQSTNLIKDKCKHYSTDIRCRKAYIIGKYTRTMVCCM